MPSKKYARKRVFRKKTTKTGKPVVSKAVKAYVKRTINVAAENKTDYNSLTNNVSNVINNAPSYLFSLMPINSAQGSTSGSRIGNRINVVKSQLLLSITCKDYTVATNSRQLAQLLTIVVFKMRQNSIAAPTYANTFGRWFQLGASAAPLDNTPMDHIRHINKELVDVKFRRTYKMGYGAGVPGSSVGTTGYQAVPNNDFKYHQFVKINTSRFMKKTHIYDDAQGTSPTNDNLWICAYCAPADNSLFTSTPLFITGDHYIEYQDF